MTHGTFFRTSFPRKRETIRDITYMQVDSRFRGNGDVPRIKSLVPCTPYPVIRSARPYGMC
jgi:hypothetical protein